VASSQSANVEALQAQLRTLETAYAELEASRAALAESEARFQRAFEHIEDVYFETTSDGRLVEVSPSVERIFGHDTQALLTAGDWLEAVFGPDGPLRLALDRGRVARDVEADLVDANGELRPCSINVRRVDDAASTRVVGSIVEVSARRRMERELLASEERFRTVFQGSPDAMVISHLVTGEIIDVNDAFEVLTGWPRSEALGKRALQLDLWEERTALRVRAALSEHGEVRSQEATFKNRRGHLVPALVSARAIVVDEVPHAVWTTRSVEELRRSQKALEITSAKFEALFENAGDAISLQDDDGNIVDVNAALCRRMGKPRTALVGLPWLDLHAPSHTGVAERAMERVRAEGECVFETVQIDGSGVPRNIEVSLRRIELPDGPAVMSIARDVTKRRTLETQLLQSQKMEAVGLLASGVAHDFNNILTVIRGLAFVLKDALPEDHEEQETIDELDRSAERAAGLTRQLLAFSRRQVTNPEDCDINALLRDLARMLRRLLPAEVKFELDLDHRDVVAHVDAGQIEQVIANLVVNAKDAIEGPGAIRLGCRTSRRQAGSSDAMGAEIPAGDYVEIEVEDTGLGIPPETITLVFEPFFTTKAKGKGTGLGLATVRDIIERASGYVELRSAPGEGTRFTLLLPAVDGLDATESMPSPPPVQLAGDERVLVVDDEASLRAVLERRFAGYGYRVRGAGNPRSALTALDEFGPLDLLVTDLVMPQGSGVELARRVRERQPQARVLFMSGYADDETLANLPRDAGVDFISKVFTPDGLLRRARALLDRVAESDDA